MAKFNLNDFLNNSVNAEIYNSIVNDEFLEPDQSYEWFVKLLVEYVDFVKINKHKPADVLKERDGYYFSLSSEAAMVEFYKYVLKLLCNEFDEKLIPCIFLLNGEYKRMYKTVYPNKKPDKSIDEFIGDYNNYLQGQPSLYKVPGEVEGPFVNVWSMRIENLKEQNTFKGKESEEAELSSFIMDDYDSDTPSAKIGFTERQQAFFFDYLKRIDNIGFGVDVVNYARFIEKILKKKSPKIKNTNLYKYLNKPLLHIGTHSSIETVKKALEEFRSLCHEINFHKFDKLIELDINKLQNDLDSL